MSEQLLKTSQNITWKVNLSSHLDLNQEEQQHSDMVFDILSHAYLNDCSDKIVETLAVKYSQNLSLAYTECSALKGTCQVSYISI